MSSTLIRSSWIVLSLASTITIPLSQASERNWTYTYNTQGLIDTVDGPRTDVSDMTRYQYDSRNRLTSIINALGHTVQFTDFDAYGNPLKIADANGVVTVLSYTPQGWLASTTTAESTLRIEYNALGDIIKLTRGDSHWLAYTWDDARRIISIANNTGERIEYNLNAMGKRTQQKVIDNTGRQAHQREWVYDELGRLLKLWALSVKLKNFNTT